jgi:hypothetical protein
MDLAYRQEIKSESLNVSIAPIVRECEQMVKELALVYQS